MDHILYMFSLYLYFSYYTHICKYAHIHSMCIFIHSNDEYVCLFAACYHVVASMSYERTYMHIRFSKETGQEIKTIKKSSE